MTDQLSNLKIRIETLIGKPIVDLSAEIKGFVAEIHKLRVAKPHPVLKNTTDIPDATILAVYKAIRPKIVKANSINIGNTAKTSGYGRALWFSKDVFVNVPTTEEAARFFWTESVEGYLPVITGSRMEVLVFIMAHELRHLWQDLIPRGKRVYGGKDQFSERDADAYALQVLRRYRRGELVVRQKQGLVNLSDFPINKGPGPVAVKGDVGRNRKVIKRKP